MLRSQIAKCYLIAILLIPNQVETLSNAVPKQQATENKQQNFPALPLHSRFSPLGPGTSAESKQANRSKLELNYAHQTFLLTVGLWPCPMGITPPAEANNKYNQLKRNSVNFSPCSSSRTLISCSICK